MRKSNTTYLRYGLLLISTICLVICLMGCSFFTSTDNTKAEPAQPPRGTISVYLAFSSFNDIEFEQYKIGQNRVFIECGRIQRGSQIPLAQHLQELDEVTSNKVWTTANMLFQSATASDLSLLDKPGDLSGFGDGGQATFMIDLNGKHLSLMTSANAVDSQSSTAMSDAYKLVKVLRNYARALPDTAGLCGNIEYFQHMAFFSDPR